MSSNPPAAPRKRRSFVESLTPKRARVGRPLQRPPHPSARGRRDCPLSSGPRASTGDDARAPEVPRGDRSDEGADAFGDDGGEEEYVRAVETLSKRGEVPVGQVRLAELESRLCITDYGQVLDFLADRGEAAVERDWLLKTNKAAAVARRELSQMRSSMASASERHEAEVQRLQAKVERLQTELLKRTILAKVANGILARECCRDFK